MAPLPIFQAILEHSDIAEAAVVGMPDKTKGQIPVGFCVLKAGKGAKMGTDTRNTLSL